MISPVAGGRAGELLLAAHATEMLARTMFTLRGSDMGLVTDQSACGCSRSGPDQVRPSPSLDDRGTRAHAGLSRRTFNAQFHRLFGSSASDYLRTSRLKSAREALLHQGFTVTEAAYAVGYTNPANFSTAFRKHFGYVPSSFQRDKALLTPAISKRRFASSRVPGRRENRRGGSSEQSGDHRHTIKGFLRTRKGIRKSNLLSQAGQLVYGVSAMGRDV